jgi:hypothetical protein
MLPERVFSHTREPGASLETLGSSVLRIVQAPEDDAGPVQVRNLRLVSRERLAFVAGTPVDLLLRPLDPLYPMDPMPPWDQLGDPLARHAAERSAGPAATLGKGDSEGAEIDALVAVALENRSDLNRRARTATGGEGNAPSLLLDPR